MNKLKTKILLLLSFIFLIILMVGIMGSQFISILSRDSGEIIKDNYKSIEYTANMLKALDGLYTLHTERDLLRHDVSALNESEQKDLTKLFSDNLKAEEKNITETGEEEIISILKQDYSTFLDIMARAEKTGGKTYSLQLRDKYEDVRSSISGIYKINSNAIINKNNKAASTARQVRRYMIILTGLSLLLALGFIAYFPGYILKPIYELTNKIKAISEGDYDQKLLFSSADELGILVKEFNSMSKKLKEYEANNLHKLLVEKKRMEAIIYSLNDAIFIIDERKNILYLNRAAQDITGLKESDVAGKSMQEVALSNDLFREILKGTIIAGKPLDTSKNTYIPIVINQKEAYFTKEIIETKLTDPENTPASTIGYIIILKNVTRYEERDTAKTNLIATVSHELKTPLSSINLSIKLLEDKRLGELSLAHQKILQTVRQETIRLSKMVNELLDYAQTESGNIRLKIGITNADAIMDYALTSLMMLISDKNISVDTTIEPGLPPIKADVEKTVWVLVNLITNAVRYTPENGILSICSSREGNFVRFSVTDKGPGIEKEDLKRIFNKFVQIGNNPRGRGLGLAIAKEFVTSQSGEIWAESQIGTGSTFSFKLPIA
ncbi:MAG: PAS domain-containing protein [Ignavibacteria bacterium]|jgi:PAS domain S-box-containing protein|nr:PAS domain-containing protein [Ignavibacteria bacterium]MCU7503539.1 PAS domain-containing protein [Ignavibacteria bacterium]MCU7516807.1 PAS domain-containing protein [Ignavibacteria bacterium]